MRGLGKSSKFDLIKEDHKHLEDTLRQVYSIDEHFYQHGWPLLNLLLNLSELLVPEAQVPALAAVHKHADVSMPAKNFVIPFHFGSSFGFESSCFNAST